MKNKRPRCEVHKKFRFRKKKDGSAVRTCTKCGMKFCDVASGKFATAIKPMKSRYKKKKDREEEEVVKPEPVPEV